MVQAEVSNVVQGDAEKESYPAWNRTEQEITKKTPLSIPGGAQPGALSALMDQIAALNAEDREFLRAWLNGPG